MSQQVTTASLAICWINVRWMIPSPTLPRSIVFGRIRHLNDDNVRMQHFQLFRLSMGKTLEEPKKHKETNISSNEFQYLGNSNESKGNTMITSIFNCIYAVTHRDRHEIITTFEGSHDDNCDALLNSLASTITCVTCWVLKKFLAIEINWDPPQM